MSSSNITKYKIIPGNCSSEFIETQHKFLQPVANLIKETHIFYSFSIVENSSNNNQKNTTSTPEATQSSSTSTTVFSIRNRFSAFCKFRAELCAAYPWLPVPSLSDNTSKMVNPSEEEQLDRQRKISMVLYVCANANATNTSTAATTTVVPPLEFLRVKMEYINSLIAEDLSESRRREEQQQLQQRSSSPVLPIGENQQTRFDLLKFAMKLQSWNSEVQLTESMVKEVLNLKQNLKDMHRVYSEATSQLGEVAASSKETIKLCTGNSKNSSNNKDNDDDDDETPKMHLEESADEFNIVYFGDDKKNETEKDHQNFQVDGILHNNNDEDTQEDEEFYYEEEEEEVTTDEESLPSLDPIPSVNNNNSQYGGLAPPPPRPSAVAEQSSSASHQPEQENTTSIETKSKANKKVTKKIIMKQKRTSKRAPSPATSDNNNSKAKSSQESNNNEVVVRKKKHTISDHPLKHIGALYALFFVRSGNQPIPSAIKLADLIISLLDGISQLAKRRRDSWEHMHEIVFDAARDEQKNSLTSEKIKVQDSWILSSLTSKNSGSAAQLRKLVSFFSGASSASSASASSVGKTEAEILKGMLRESSDATEKIFSDNYVEWKNFVFNELWRSLLVLISKAVKVKAQASIVKG